MIIMVIIVIYGNPGNLPARVFLVRTQKRAKYSALCYLPRVRFNDR